MFKYIVILFIEDFQVDLYQYEKCVQEVFNWLEYEMYIQCNGEEYEYLINIEKDIENEIKYMFIDIIEVNEMLVQVFYKDVFWDIKICYQDNQQDYLFVCKFDGILIGCDVEFSLNIISLQYEYFGVFVILKFYIMVIWELLALLLADDCLLKDICMYKQVDKYFCQNIFNQFKEEVYQILQCKKVSNDQLYKSLIVCVEWMLGKVILIFNGEELFVLFFFNVCNWVMEGLQEFISYVFLNLCMLKQGYMEQDLKNIL